MQWCVLQTAHHLPAPLFHCFVPAKLQDLRQFEFGSNTIQYNCSYKYKYEYRYYISIALFCSAKLRDLRQFEFGSNFACYPPFPPRNILVAGFQGLQQKHFQKKGLVEIFSIHLLCVPKNRHKNLKLISNEDHQKYFSFLALDL